MRNLFQFLCHRISILIDFCYPPFRRYMSLQFFRYGATGGLNLLFDWVLYFLIYNYLLQHRMLELGFVTISSHIAALGIKFPLVLLSGFILQKYVTFSGSALKGRIQLFRYLVVVLINLIVNYIGLKFFVEYLHIYPTPSIMLISLITILVSFFSQKHYTFK